MAAIQDRVKIYNFTNEADYTISQDSNAWEVDNNGNPIMRDTCEITGDLVKLLQSKLDEDDSALGITPSSSDPAVTNPDNMTDGDSNTYGVIHHTTQPDWVKIDLGSIVQLRRIILKHIYQGRNRKYRSVAIKISSDDITYVYVYNNNKIDYPGLPELPIGTNNEYTEIEDGLTIELNNLDARYIVIYGFGSTIDPSQTEIREIEIYQALFWPYGYVDVKDTQVYNKSHSVSDFILETITKIGTQDVKYILPVDGQYKYWDGVDWVDSNGTFYQSNTAVDLVNNIDFLLDTKRLMTGGLRIALKADDDGLSTPELDDVTISAEYDPNYLPNYCRVYSYLNDLGININPAGVTITFRLEPVSEAAGYVNNANILLFDDVIIEPDGNGYFEQKLVPNDVSLPSTAKYMIIVKKGTKKYLERRIAVPNTTKENVVDIFI